MQEFEEESYAAILVSNYVGINKLDRHWACDRHTVLSTGASSDPTQTIDEPQDLVRCLYEVQPRKDSIACAPSLPLDMHFAVF